MAFNISERTVSTAVAQDLSNNQYQFVTLDSTGQAIACGVNTVALGILSNKPSPGLMVSGSQVQATIAVDGVSRLVVTGAYPPMTYLVPATTSDGVGWGSTVADAGSSNEYVRALQLQPSLAAGDIVAVKLCDPTPGAAGLSGYSGARGTSGYSGQPNTGASGYSGQVGTSGYSGVSGYSGISGYSGYSGTSGYSGESGYSGYSGTSGYSGESGYSGYSGTSGYSGESGYSGYSGQV